MFFSTKKEKGFIGSNFSLALEAITLWKIGPFRKFIYRDFDNRCKSGFGCVSWTKR